MTTPEEGFTELFQRHHKPIGAYVARRTLPENVADVIVYGPGQVK